MAGTHHTGKGGAGNHQCMPQEPEYNLWYNTTSYTIISGAEYQGVSPIFDGSSDENVPCARCYSENSAVMMIPAKRSCPESWHKEYEGASNRTQLEFERIVERYFMQEKGYGHQKLNIQSL